MMRSKYNLINVINLCLTSTFVINLSDSWLYRCYEKDVFSAYIALRGYVDIILASVVS